jgi:hypothetical protein
VALGLMSFDAEFWDEAAMASSMMTMNDAPNNLLYKSSSDVLSKPVRFFSFLSLYFYSEGGVAFKYAMRLKFGGSYVSSSRSGIEAYNIR